MISRYFRIWAGALLLGAVVGSNAIAGSTLRVGNKVLVVGDTAVQVIDLLGTPALKIPVENKYGAYVGEKWQYAPSNGHVVVITFIQGQVADIDDRPD